MPQENYQSLHEMIQAIFSDINTQDEDAIPSGELRDIAQDILPAISQFVRDDALVFASFVADHFDDFQAILVFLFSKSNSALQEQAVAHAEKLKDQKNAFALVSTISYNTHLYKPQQLFKKTFDIEDLKGCAEDLVADVVYYNRKEDEEFTVEDAQDFFNSVDNIEAFTKAFKEAMIKRCIKSNYN